ncbi:MAG: hypothetical protein IKS20_04150, partial [Victivallales bacterium]|nr:hypothetical protein [Victivallales bacterium]
MKDDLKDKQSTAKEEKRIFGVKSVYVIVVLVLLALAAILLALFSNSHSSTNVSSTSIEPQVKPDVQA